MSLSAFRSMILAEMCCDREECNLLLFIKSFAAVKKLNN
jgi:hypothetical protein